MNCTRVVLRKALNFHVQELFETTLVATLNAMSTLALKDKLGLIIPSLCAMDYGITIMGYDWAWDYGI